MSLENKLEQATGAIKRRIWESYTGDQQKLKQKGAVEKNSY